MGRLFHAALVATFTGGVFLTPALGHAATSAENKAAARSLGIQGIQLAQQDNCAEALPLLQRAESLYHAPTILGWLGECQIRLGQIVAGTESLRRVVREELEDGAPAAFKRAQERAEKVLAEATPKIANLTIQIAPSGVEGLDVQVGNAKVPVALLGVARPTDPGEHEVVATAPGYLPARTTVTLDEGDSETISLELEVDPSATATSADTDSSTPGLSATSESGDPRQDSDGSMQRTLGFVGASVGAALVAGGAVTGFMAMGKESTLQDKCPDGHCPETQRDTLESADSLATVSTVLFGVGAAVGITGVVLLLTDRGDDDAPSESASSENARSPSPTIDAFIGFDRVGLYGTF